MVTRSGRHWRLHTKLSGFIDIAQEIGTLFFQAIRQISHCIIKEAVRSHWWHTFSQSNSFVDLFLKLFNSLLCSFFGKQVSPDQELLETYNRVFRPPFLD